jgi:hypothetical protein
MQQRTRRAEYPIVSPSIEIPQSSVPPPSVANKGAGECGATAERFYGHQKLWGETLLCQKREGLIVLDVAAVAGGNKAHLANARNSNLKCRCEKLSPFYSNQIVFVFEFKCSLPASLPYQGRSAQVSFAQKHSYVHLPFPVT